jgi:glyoxylase-like metal-dependent hydrolase (beta-lactamase superfamily II)
MSAPSAESTAPQVVQVEVGLVSNFCTLICDPRRRSCAIVDPAFEVDRLVRLIGELRLRLEAVLLTHSHFDHIEGLPALLQKSGLELPIYVGAAESEVVRKSCEAAGLTVDLRPTGGGEALRVGDLDITVLATPGHTAAGRSYYLPELAAVVTGDTLFVGSCGRPASHASTKTLWQSLSRLAELPEETRIYPGHNYGRTPTSTIGWERDENPYLGCPDEATFTALCRSRMG